MTQHKTIFDALAAPFAATEVKVRSQAGRQFSYVTARTIMNRLDEVLGPENWWDQYTPLEHSVICQLSIRLPDGQVVTKCDAGGEAGMADAGDNDKSGFSDAFKRAAVKFGTSRYLYRDGVPALTSSAPEPAVEVKAPEAPATPVPKRKRDEIKTGRELFQYAENCKIDPCLKGWIVGHFGKFGYPAKITTWSQAQVAEALPDIRKHLEAAMASKSAA